MTYAKCMKENLKKTEISLSDKTVWHFEKSASNFFLNKESFPILH